MTGNDRSDEPVIQTLMPGAYARFAGDIAAWVADLAEDSIQEVQSALSGPLEVSEINADGWVALTFEVEYASEEVTDENASYYHSHTMYFRPEELEIVQGLAGISQSIKMIRTAGPDDEATIRACAESAYQRYVAAIGCKPAPMVADFGLQIANDQIYVAVGEDGNLLGFIVFYTHDDTMRLENVAVDPAASGRGVGKSLIRFCEDEARRFKCRAVQLYTNEKMTDNLGIYPHLGYVEFDRRKEDGFNRVFFEKYLGEQKQVKWGETCPLNLPD